MNVSSSHSQKTLTGTIGHRGSREKAPENTMASFRQAVEDGADGIELDVQLSKDGELVVIHDGTLDRTTNGQGSVSEYTLEEIRNLDAGSWFDPKFAGEKVPTLDESLQWAKGKTRVDIEVKKEATAHITPESLIGAVRAHGMENEVAITSFDRQFVETVEELAPNIETGVLVSGKPTGAKMKKGGAIGLATGLATGYLATGNVWGTLGFGLLGTALGTGGGYLSGASEAKETARTTTADTVLPNWMIATPGVVKTAEERGKSVVPYTVNNSTMAKVLNQFGVEGIVTDRPHDFS